MTWTIEDWDDLVKGVAMCVLFFGGIALGLFWGGAQPRGVLGDLVGTFAAFTFLAAAAMLLLEAAVFLLDRAQARRARL